MQSASRTRIDSDYSIPYCMQRLAAIFPDVSPLNNNARKSDAADTTESMTIQKLLDGLTYFLRTGKNQKKVYAMALAEDELGLVAVVAANDHKWIKSHDKDAPPIVLSNIFQHLKKCLSAIHHKDPLIHLFRQEFAHHLLNLHQDVLDARFHKNKKEAYLKLRDSYHRSADGLSGITREYFDSLEKLYQATSTLLADHVTELSLNEFIKIEADCIRLSGIRNKGFPSPREKINIINMHMRAQPRSTSHAVEGLLAQMLRYSEKLASPMIHIATILALCSNIAIQTLFQNGNRMPRISVAPNPEMKERSIPNHLGLYDTRATKDFMLSVFTRSELAQNPRLVTIAAKKAPIVVAQTKKGKPLPRVIGPPHCEAVLLLCFFNNPTFTPIVPYMAVTKLACYQCGLFIDGYNEYLKNFADENPLVWKIKGRHDHVYPYILPYVGAAHETITRTITERTREILKAAVDMGLGHVRSISESTSGSGLHDDEINN